MKFHTPKTFLQYGWKQGTTIIGIILILVWFLISFYSDIHTLIHNVLTSPSLSEKVITGLGGIALVLFNKFNKDQ